MGKMTLPVGLVPLLLDIHPVVESPVGRGSGDTSVVGHPNHKARRTDSDG